MKSITQTVEKFIKSDQNLDDGRYKSWENCFKFFQHFDKQDWDYATLMLAFYLASWGMYRGSSFLLQYTHTIHKKPLEIIFDPKYQKLRHKRILSQDEIPLLFTLVEELKKYYFEKNKKVHSSLADSSQVSDTLISKVLMGVLGNIPAYDRYVKAGLKKLNLSQTMSEKGYLQLLNFYNRNQAEIDNLAHKYPEYPPMKLIDMYFWQLGAD